MAKRSASPVVPELVMPAVAPGTDTLAFPCAVALSSGCCAVKASTIAADLSSRLMGRVTSTLTVTLPVGQVADFAQGMV